MYKNKIIKLFSLLFSVILLCTVFASCKSNTHKNDSGTGDDKEETTTMNKDHVIVCFGDSITEGMRMARSDCYPSVLKANINNDDFEVLNSGVGGEGSYTISARANALEFTVTNDITFNKGVKEVLCDWKLFSGINGEEMKFRYGTMGRELPITKLVIDGKPYTLRFEYGNTEEEGRYYLGRQDVSSAETIKVGSKCQFNYSEYFDKPYCIVVLMGANDGNIDTATLISRYQAIADTCERFIAIIPHFRPKSAAEFKAAFGDRCVNLYEYCTTKVFEDYGFEKTPEDELDIKAGRMPRSVLLNNNVGDCHLNEKGYKALGDLVYQKGVELGYWN